MGQNRVETVPSTELIRDEKERKYEYRSSPTTQK